MKTVFSSILALVLISGCVCLPPEPAAETRIERTGKNPGKTSVAERVSYYLNHYISLKTGIALERTGSAENGAVRLTAYDGKSEERVFLEVQRFGITAEDAVLKPLAADLAVEVLVLDRNGSEIYRRKVERRYRSPKVFGYVEESIEDIAAGAAAEVLNEFAQDPELKRIIARQKYGVLGSIATVF